MEIDWLELVLKEEKMRLSEEMQNHYRAVEIDSSYMDWIHFTESVIQRRVLLEAGVEPNPQNIRRLQIAAQKTNVFWIKYNRARQGSLRESYRVPSVLIHDVAKVKQVSILHKANFII